MICKAENLNVDEAALVRLMNLTSGDLRRAVNLLQVGILHIHCTQEGLLGEGGQFCSLV